jgi:hypothetical protein
MSEHDYLGTTEAEFEFRKARRRAILSSIFYRIRGEADELISLADAKSIVSPRAESYVGRKVVQVKQIVGSEERYTDFNRHFLPRKNFLYQRWKSIFVANLNFKTLPPVLLYELGGLYFIRDGNHRVAVAKRRKVDFIEADVTSLASEVSLPPVAGREELRRAVLEYEHERFLELLPDIDLRFTAPGGYDDIAVHIASHRAYIRKDRGTTLSVRDATRLWYEKVFRPISQFIRDSKILEFLPRRTDADLYVWLVRHWDDIHADMGTSGKRRAKKSFATQL